MSAVLPAAPARSASEPTPCFHCNLPAEGAGASRAYLDGAWRTFCCPGCEAVASAILGEGLAAYYRLREAAPARAQVEDVDEAAMAAHDDPTFQASFVSAAADGTREAGLLLEGVRCAACVWLIERTLAHLPGIVSVEVNYVTRRVQLRWDPARVKLSDALRRIHAVGYRAHPFHPDRAEALHEAERRRWLWRLFVAGFGMMQVMMYAFPAYFATDGSMSADVGQLMRWASLLLTVPVVGYAAQPFFQGAWREWRARRFGMDFPVALGVAVGFAASAWATFTGGGEVYFDSVTMFVFALLLGRYLELLARMRAGGALTALARLAPAFAERCTDWPTGRTLARVPVAQLAAGEHVLVRPGEAVPADGVVVEGESTVSEALLTGESRPLPKRRGGSLVGGSLNLGSPLVMRVERVGAQTVLAAIVRLVERAAAERQPLAELADDYAHRFVLLVLGVAVLTGAAWMFIDAARAPWIVVAVLVATCPCALSLATPVALTVTTGELARIGFIVTRGRAIEGLARATDVVFDKTGTLSEGRPVLQDVEVSGELSVEQTIALAAALETGSEHPLARAVLDRARRDGGATAVAEGVRSVPGQGVEGRVDGVLWRFGRRAFVHALGGAGTDARAGDCTEAWLGDARGPIARLCFGDALKPGARGLVGALEHAGKRVHLLSGDTEGAVSAAAAALGITRACAAATPADKQARVLALQRDGAVVAMVGDGINDAPVLAQADVSIAMGSGATLAQAHADAVLLGGRPADLMRAARLATRAMSVVRQNLAWAFGYNFVAIPAAASGWVSPWLAALGMSASSLLVIGNALRLRRRVA